MKDQISFIDDQYKKAWSKEEDAQITDVNFLLNGKLPMGRNLSGCQRRLLDIITKNEKEHETYIQCKKILQLLGNKNKTLKIKEN